MKNSPGFLQELQSRLEMLTLSELDRVNRLGGLEISVLLDFILKPQDFSVHIPDPVDDNKIVTTIEVDTTGLGRNALEDGSTAYCILAGGAGTRAGGTKALMSIPGREKTLLQLKIEQASSIPHVWVMVSPSNRRLIEKHLDDVGLLSKVELFEQYESFRLTPDNRLSVVDGSVETHPCGHGDLVPALKHSGFLEKFRISGGRRVHVVNSDNAAARPSAALVGQHIVGNKPVTCEVVERRLGDSGGILCSHAGFDQIVEMFRLTAPADYDEFKWISTNTMIFDIDLDFESIPWMWHRVKKTVDNRLVVQYERLLQQLTSHFQTQFVAAHRESRFLPVKTVDDLQNVTRIIIE